MFINRFEQAEGKNQEFEDRSTEIIQAEEQKERRMKKNEQNLIDCRDITKNRNIP